METKWTMGPWTVGNPEGENGYIYIMVGGHTEVAAIRHIAPGSAYVVEDCEERKANAELIASAPNLYAENKRLREALEDFLDYYEAYNPITDKRIEPYAKAARAALKGEK